MSIPYKRTLSSASCTDLQLQRGHPKFHEYVVGPVVRVQIVEGAKEPKYTRPPYCDVCVYLPPPAPNLRNSGASIPPAFYDVTAAADIPLASPRCENIH